MPTLTGFAETPNFAADMEISAKTPDISTIRLTESAASQVKQLLANEPDSAGKALRLYVEAGGCSGMQYGMVFDPPRDDDWQQEFFGVRVVVDPFSANYLQGTTIDYVDSLTGGGFKITNPNAVQNCGCGKSFET
jgi:iron-sulfur cluster assembly protein